MCKQVEGYLTKRDCLILKYYIHSSTISIATALYLPPNFNIASQNLKVVNPLPLDFLL